MDRDYSVNEPVICVSCASEISKQHKRRCVARANAFKHCPVSTIDRSFARVVCREVAKIGGLGEEHFFYG